MPGAHFTCLLEPMDRSVQLVEVQKLVKSANAARRNLARIVHVEPIHGGVKASIRPPGKPIEILDTKKLQSLFE